MRRPAVLSAALFALSLAASSAPAQDAAPPKAYRVMLVGNSLTYTNNLPALLRAVGARRASASRPKPGPRPAAPWPSGCRTGTSRRPCRRDRWTWR